MRVEFDLPEKSEWKLGRVRLRTDSLIYTGSIYAARIEIVEHDDAQGSYSKSESGGVTLEPKIRDVVKVSLSLKQSICKTADGDSPEELAAIAEAEELGRKFSAIPEMVEACYAAFGNDGGASLPANARKLVYNAICKIEGN